VGKKENGNDPQELPIESICYPVLLKYIQKPVHDYDRSASLPDSRLLNSGERECRLSRQQLNLLLRLH
jgi:hypothetical protein